MLKIPMLGSMGMGYVVAAGHPLTTEAAACILQSGGNAFDAALAGWLVSCLSEPVLTSPAGGGFAMVAPASGRPRLYDFFTQTPKVATPDSHTYPLKADFGSTHQVFHLGAGTVATPGCVAGILKLHQDLGRLPVAECAAPAMEHVRSGLLITTAAETLFKVVRDLYLATPDSRALFRSREAKDACLQAGEWFSNPDFGNFLDMLISEGSRWFYHGDIARLVSDYCRDHGGHLRRADFEDYSVEVREPLQVNHNGATIWLNPPPSMGGTLIALGLLGNEGGTLSAPFGSRAYWKQWAEPLRLMSLVRSPSAIANLDESQLTGIRSACAASPDLAASMSHLFPQALDQAHSSGTTQISIMDDEGNEISMTTSNGAGSAIIPKGTGFMLNNMLGEEDLQPEGLHTWKTDRRLSSMMAPTLAKLPDGTRFAVGSGGSNRIRSTILQILRHLIEGGASLEEAVEAPRMHWEAGYLHAETVAAKSISTLQEPLPWPVIEHAIPNLFFGGAHSVARLPNGSFSGIGDPRRGGATRSS